MNEQTCLILVGACIAKIAFIFLDQGFILVGVNQYPNQSFFWLPIHTWKDWP